MVLSWITKFWEDMRKPPSVQDVQSVIGTSGAGGCVTAINALIFVALARPHPTPAFITIWCALTLLTCAIVFVRTRRANARSLTYVSRKAIRRLNMFAAILALPWAVLAFVKIGLQDADSSVLVIMVCAGMSAGGTFMLHRTTSAALIYYSLILGSVVLSALVGNTFYAAPITLYAIVYGGFLCYFGMRTADTARELDQSVIDLEATVSELDVSQKKNYRLANVDNVTGLPNRTAFNRYLDRLTLGEPIRPGFALFLLDLDHFKNVNDLYGHGVGDQLLGKIGERLQSFIQEEGNTPSGTQDENFVARLGGDEFVVILDGLEAPISMACAQKLIEALNKPIDLDGKQIFPGVSIGIAQYPEHGEHPSELTRNADLALNQAKESGRGTARLFDDTLRSGAVMRDRLEKALRAALMADQIEVRYQPQICMARQQVCGAEALVRWQNNELGSSSPDVFLPIAAESGLLPALSQRVVELVARDLIGWRQAGLTMGRIAINVHPIELRSPDLLLKNIDYLASQGLGVEDLTIEVTEGCLIGRGSEAAQYTLDRLADRGYELSLDDFGTGFASLSHLRNLPVSEIKIDRSFVSALPDSASDHAIIAATIQLARGMGLRTVAEGIETEDQKRAMLEMGVDQGQGYLWAPALKKEDFADFVCQQNDRSQRAALG